MKKIINKLEQSLTFKISNKNLFKSIFTHPLMGIKILVGIHWEAIRLFIKGIKTVSYKV